MQKQQSGFGKARSFCWLDLNHQHLKTHPKSKSVNTVDLKYLLSYLQLVFQGCKVTQLWRTVYHLEESRLLDGKDRAMITVMQWLEV